jgi:hypothetical protein
MHSRKTELSEMIRMAKHFHKAYYNATFNIIKRQMFLDQ